MSTKCQHTEEDSVVDRDRNNREFCALCGMAVPHENKTMKKLEGVTRYFCGTTCYEKYKKFRIPAQDIHGL